MDTVLPSLIIAVEGIDGVGKSTVCKHLEASNTSMGHKARVFSFPYGDTELTEHFNRFLAQPTKLLQDRDNFTERAKLFTAGRHVASLQVRDWLAANPGSVALLDRWDWSTYAYAPDNVTDSYTKSVIDMYEAQVAEVVDTQLVQPDGYVLLSRSSDDTSDRADMNSWDSVYAGKRELIEKRYRRLFNTAALQHDTAVELPVTGYSVEDTVRLVNDFIIAIRPHARLWHVSD